jgi:drug/metabolite transporter (DMT)-like permease
VLPFGLVLGAVARIGAQRGSIIGASEPLWAAIVAYFALNELLGPMQLIGGGLIVAAIVIGESGAMKAQQHDEVDAG